MQCFIHKCCFCGEMAVKCECVLHGVYVFFSSLNWIFSQSCKWMHICIGFSVWLYAQSWQTATITRTFITVCGFMTVIDIRTETLQEKKGSILAVTTNCSSPAVPLKDTSSMVVSVFWQQHLIWTGLVNVLWCHSRDFPSRWVRTERSTYKWFTFLLSVCSHVSLVGMTVCVCVCVYFTGFCHLFRTFSGINTVHVRTSIPHGDQRLVLMRHDLISEVLVKFRGKV